MAEGSDVFAGFLAVLAVLGAGWVTIRAATRAPRAAPLRVRAGVAPGTAGPVRALLDGAKDADTLSIRLEEPARRILLDWLAARGVPANEAGETARSGRLRLDPVLVHLLEQGSADEWWREDARARWRGPSFLFTPWRRLVELTGSREARCVRWLDLMTRKLEETVQSR